MVVYRCLVLQIWEYLKDVTWEGQYVHTSVLKFISAIDTCDHRIDQSATATSVTPTSGPQQGCQNSHVTTGNTEHGGRECSDGEYVGKVCVCGGGGGGGRVFTVVGLHPYLFIAFIHFQFGVSYNHVL